MVHEPTGARARHLLALACASPDDPELPGLLGRAACDPDAELRDAACTVVERFARSPGLDVRVARAVGVATAQDDGGAGAHELVTTVAELWAGDPARAEALAVLVSLLVPSPPHRHEQHAGQTGLVCQIRSM